MFVLCVGNLFGGVSALCTVLSDLDGPPTAIPFGHRCTVGVKRPGRAEDQQCANPLAAALLLHCTELDTCVRVRPSLIMRPQTHPLGVE